MTTHLELDDMPASLTHAEVSEMVGRTISVEEANAYDHRIGCSLVDLYNDIQRVWG